MMKNMGWQYLYTTRKQVKKWTTFNAAIKWLFQMDIKSFHVDLTQWHSKQSYLEID